MAKTFDVKTVVYTKTPTGQRDSYGRNTYTTTARRDGKVIKNTNWKQLKSDVYNASKGKKDVFVNWEDAFEVRKKKRLKSVTKTFADGHKEVTYYSAR